MGNKEKNKANFLNRNAFLFYYQWIKLLCLSMFKWDNLPAGCDSDFIEKQLYENGRVIFANHKKYGIINLALTDDYKRNVYDKPIIYTGIAGSFKMSCDFRNSYIVQNNILNIPSLPIACFFAEKISNVDRVWDVNLLGQKTPLIFKASPEEYFTLENIINDIYSNVPILKTKDKFDLNSKLEVLKTDMPYLLDKLKDSKTNVMNELLTFLGIKNVAINKRERLVTDEANSNNELVALDLNIFLSKRKEAAKEINKKFGTNIKVEAVQNIVEKFNETLKKLEEGGKNNDTSEL